MFARGFNGSSMRYAFGAVRKGSATSSNRLFSTENKGSSFSKVSTFLSANKQGIINVIGIYMIFSMSVSNVRQQKLQKDHEAALQLATQHLSKTQEMLMDDEWCLEVVDKLQKVSKRAEKGKELSREISLRLDHADYLARHTQAQETGTKADAVADSQSSTPAVAGAKMDRII